MKKIILLAVLLLSTIFYASATTFNEAGFISGDGYIFTDNTIQEGLYSGNGEVSKPIEVSDGETIYERWGSYYLGEATKQKINVVYPMLINDGTAIKLLNSTNDVIDDNFIEHDGYENLIISNGEAYNTDLERADNYNYILTRLVNNLYINNAKIKIQTIGNSYSIKVNSFIYFTPESIYYYEYSYGTMKFDKIEDMMADSTITIGDNELAYEDFLILIGEEELPEDDNRSKEDIADESKTSHQQSQYSGTSHSTNGTTNKSTNTNSTNSGNGKGNGSAPAPTKTKKAKAAETADKATGPTEAAGQIETDQTIPDARPSDTEWVMPTVDASKFNSTVSTTANTLSFEITVSDPGSYIYYNNVIFEIVYDDENVSNNGTTFARRSARVSNGTNTIRITGLKSETGYTIKGYFQYKDKYGALVNEPVTFLNTTHFDTKPNSDLGTIYFDLGNISDNTLYSNQIKLTDISFTSDSSLDAISSIKSIVLSVDDGVSTPKRSSLSEEQLEKMKGGSKVTLSSASTLTAGTTYTGTIFCYDEFNNPLTVANNTFTANTCKTLPKASFGTFTYPTLESLSFEVNLTNPDSVSYSNLRAVIRDSSGNAIKFNGNDFLSISAGNTYTVDNLGVNKNYSISILADCDINDGKGKTEHTLLIKTFVTGNISSLGKLYLNVKNVSSTYLDDGENINTYERAVLSMQINSIQTNDELLDYLDVLTIKLNDSKSTIDYSLSADELAALKNGELIYLDTDKMTDNGLTSNTNYKVSYAASCTSVGETVSITVNSTLGRIKTPKEPMRVEFKALEAYEGFITATFRVVDNDNISNNSNIILRVLKNNADGSKKLIGSFNVPANEYYDLAMFSDASYSSDGKAYQIDGNSTYTFRFIAEEADLDDGLLTNYTFFEKDDIKTEAGVSASIQLNSLNEYVDGTNQARVPDGYTELEYIESTGTQWIDTGYKLSADSKIETKFIKYSGTSVFGAFHGGSPFTHLEWNSNLYFGGSSFSSVISTNVLYEFESETTSSKTYSYTINGSTKSGTYSGVTDTDCTFKLFASQNNGGSISSSRIYYMKMYDNGTLVRDYVPAMRNSDGVLGLYDLVSNTFYTNQGTGTFIGGTEVNDYSENTVDDLFSNVTNLSSGEVSYQFNDFSKYEDTDNFTEMNEDLKNIITDGDESYTELEYIESTGTQYIDTGYEINTNSYNLTKFRLIANFVSSGGGWMINGTGSGGTGVFSVGFNPSMKFTYGNGNTDITTTYTSSYNTIYQYDLDFPNNYYEVCDETGNSIFKITNINKANPSMSKNLYLFEYNRNNVPDSRQGQNERIYSAQIYNNGVLVRDYVPAKRNSDGVLGLYDLVNNTFYTNAGSGEFKAGPEVLTNQINEELYTRIDYVQSNGTQYIDTGYVSKANTNVITYGYKDDNTNTRYYYGDTTNSFNDSSISQTGFFKSEKNLSASTTSLKLFAKGDGDSLELSPSRTTIYWLRVYEGDTLVRDYVPVMRYSDNAVGLYDCVNEVFYPSSNDSELIEPVSELSVDKSYAPTGVDVEKMYDASFTVNLSDERLVSGDQKVYVDVYRYKDGTLTNISSGSPTTLTYKGNSAKIDFDLAVYIDDKTDDYYYLELYTVLGNKIKVPLDNLSFSTEEKIYSISTMEEFFNIGSSSRKYVVVNDLEYTANYKGRDDTTNQGTFDGIHWRSSYFNARVDFQGFSMTLNGTGPLIYRTTRKAEIKNIVFIDNVYNSYSTSDISGCGTLVYYNYGDISDIYVEYSEESKPYMYSSYYTTVEDGEDVPHYRYHKAGGIAGENYGTIENFVINCLTDYTCSRQSGFVTIWNGPGGIVKNGYIYSSENDDYKANVNVYYNDSSNDYFSAAVSYNWTGGTIENVYALANVNLVGFTGNFNATGIITGQNYGIVKNCYSVGDTTYGKGTNKKPTTYGPAVGYTSSSYTNKNIYYVSENNYTSSNSTSFNNAASVMSLRSTAWQNNVLGSGNFNVDAMIEASCYPQLNYSSESMPIQDMIPLPTLSSYGLVDLTYSYTYEMGTDETIDSIFGSYLEDVEVGNKIYDDENADGYSSDVQPVILLFTDRASLQVESITANGIDLKVISSIADGKGMTTVYALAYNPTYGKDKYQVQSIKFYDDDENVQIPSGRYLNVEYYREINSVDKWIELLHNSNNNTLSQNYILMNDLDFTGKTISDVFVKGTYTGTFDGNNKTISNIAYSSVDENVAGSITSNMGLFQALNSSVYDLTLSNIYFEGGVSAGILTGQTSGGTIQNIHVYNSYVAGLNNVGGLIGLTNAATKIINCSLSDVKVLSTGGYVNGSYNDVSVGGMIGYVNGLIDVLNCYVQDVYVENWVTADASSVGGLIGRNGNGAYTSIENTYVTGNIVGTGDGVGGLIGITHVVNQIDNVYTNVDILNYEGNVGGLIGFILNSSSQIMSNTLEFGTITYGNIMDADDERLAANSYICMQTAYSSGASYYTGNKTQIKCDDGTIIDAPSSSYNSAFSSFTSEEVMSKLNENYFVQSNNQYLPKVLTTDGEEMVGQKDELISDNNVVSVTSAVYDEGNIKVTLRYSSDVVYDSINPYMDFTYIEDTTGLNEKGINSYSIQPSFIYGSTSHSSPIDNGDGTYTTTITYNNVSIKSAHDLYLVTAVEYKLKGDNETYYFKANKVIDGLYKQYKYISNASDWATLFDKNRSVAENIIIDDDIDFSSAELSYNGQNGANVIVNRIVGSKTTGDYLDIQNGKCDGVNTYPYYCLSNIDLDNVYDSAGINWVYGGSVNLIKSCVTEMSYLSFSNVNIKSNYRAGIVNYLTGDANNLTFTNCNITSGSTSNANSIFDMSSGMISKIYVNDTSVSAKTNDTGILIGIARTNKRHVGIDHVSIDDSSVNSSASSCGGIVGAIYNGGQNFYDGSSVYTVSDTLSYTFKVDDCELNNVTVKSTGNTGGISGYAQYSVYFRNNKIAGSTISGSTGSSSNATGGIAGYCWNDSNLDRFINNTVYNSTISGAYNVGGISGDRGYMINNLVDECTIIGTSSNVGGLWGTSAGSYTSRTNQAITSDSETCGFVENTNIYGNVNVGGIAGTNASWTSVEAIGFVDNCYIYGNSNVGGAFGYVGRYCVSTPYISNTLISAIDSTINGISKASTQQYFGGLVGYGGRASGFVDKCIIGGDDVNYVGGLQGRIDYYESTYVQCNAICRDSIVIGNDYVAGLYGEAKTLLNNSGNYYKLVSTGNYSNATVIGNDYVVGICGKVGAYLDTNKESDTYNMMVNMPYIEYAYFTGTLKSNNNASAIFGEVIGNTCNLTINGLVSMPDSITAKKVDVVLIDGSDTYSYNWSNLINESSNLKISLWSDTKISISSDPTITSMDDLLKADKYKNHVGTMDEVTADYTGGEKENRKFIYEYVNGTSVEVNNGYRSEFESLTDYTQLEYLKSTGTQFIIIPYQHNADTWMDMDVSFNSIYSYNTIIGAASGDNTSDSMTFGVMAGNKFNHDLGKLVQVSSPAFVADQEYNIVWNFATSYVDGTEYKLNGNPNSCKYNTEIFGRNLSNSYYSEIGKCAFYGLKIYEGTINDTSNSTLKFDLVPAKRNSDGALGLYDLVSNTFYTNNGTGVDFTAGAEITKPSSDENAYAYLTNYIYSFSLTGAKVNDSVNRFYYNQNISKKFQMPYTTTTSKLWEGVSHSSLINPYTGNQYSNTITQGVAIPGSSDYLSSLSERERLYKSYGYYKNGSISKIAFEENKKSNPSEDKVASNLDVYASSVNTINLDINGSLDTYTELEYIESTGTQWIDTGYKLSANSKIETKFIKYSGTSVFGAFHGDSPWTHLESNGALYFGGSSFGGVISTNVLYEFESETTSSKTYSYTINGSTKSGTYSGATDTDCTYKLFASQNNGGSISSSRIYYMKMYDNGTLVRDYVPAMRNSDGVLGMYDLVTNTFYTNKGSGTFIGGDPAAVNSLAQLNQIEIKDSEGNDVLTKQVPTKSTYTLNCNFVDDLVLNVYSNCGTANEKSISYNIKASNLLVSALSYGSEGYYINPNNGLVYAASTNNVVSTLDSSLTYINLYDRYVTDVGGTLNISSGCYALGRDGNVYDISNGTKVTSSAITNSAISDSLYLYKFSYSNDYYTYGTYTFVDYKNGASTTTKNRFYVINSEPKIIKSNNNATYNDYFIYQNGDDVYECYLKNDGTIRSVGNKDLLSYLNNGTFDNSGIKHITSNIDKGGSILIVTYYSGTINGYDLSKGSDNLLFSTNKITKSFGSFLMSSLRSLLNLNSSSTDSENREVADNVVSLLSTNNVSLNQVVTGVSESDDGIEEDLVEDEDTGKYSFSSRFMMTLSNLFSSNEDTNESDETDSDISVNKNNNVNGDITITTDGAITSSLDTSLKPLINGVTDGSQTIQNIGEKLLTIDNADNKYVVAYDEEKEDYDIYTVEELLENPVEPESENDKVIDKSTLRSLYNALGQEDKDDSHGITLYVLVAAAISTLLAIFAVVNKIKSR